MAEVVDPNGEVIATIAISPRLHAHATYVRAEFAGGYALGETVDLTAIIPQATDTTSETLSELLTAVHASYSEDDMAKTILQTERFHGGVSKNITKHIRRFERFHLLLQYIWQILVVCAGKRLSNIAKRSPGRDELTTADNK